MKGKQFRKSTLVEVVDEVGDGYIVQNVDQPSDQWLVDFESFHKLYEEVEL